MATATLVTVQEYLNTAYRPDCDYIDGEVLERNCGQKDHSTLQAELLAWFRDRRHTLKLRAYPEQRLQVGLRRYRVPDVCVVELPEPDEQIFTRPPFICIEILSPEDSFRTLQGSSRRLPHPRPPQHLGSRPHVPPRLACHPARSPRSPRRHSPHL